MKVGERHGPLEILELRPNERMLIRCGLCGRTKDVWRSSVHLARPPRSCGCHRTEAVRAANTHHGHTRRDGYRSREYRSWEAMVSRCTRPTHKSYARYGGRGITICERWRTFANFLSDLGHRPDGMSLERINNDGNYEPGNVRWATTLEQGQNKRHVNHITVNGATHTLREWSVASGIDFNVLDKRYRAGDIGDRFLRPVRKYTASR